MKDVQVTLVIPFRYVTTLVQVGRKNVRILVDCSILNGRFVAVLDFVYLFEPAIQKIDLDVKCPFCHIVIKVSEVRICVNRLVEWVPSIVFCKSFRKACFSGSYIPTNRYML